MARTAPATLRLPKSLAASLRSGHPWVYRTHVPRDFAGAPGFVRVVTEGFSAFALWEPNSALALRIFSRERCPDEPWIKDRIDEAVHLREPLACSGHTTAYRLINGEGDGLPGVVVDWYDGFAVVVLDTPVLEQILPWLVAGIMANVPAKGVVLKVRGGDAKLRLLAGSMPPEGVQVMEHGLRFRVNLAAGQKTGLFLDHRENRAHIEGLARGHSVLNLFAYTGAFSLYAARGGAQRIVSVDIAAGAMDNAKDNFRLNGFEQEPHQFLVRDAYEALKGYVADGTRFDLVILDPPSLARNKEQLANARRAYTRLNALAAEVVANGGLLATASCTARISPQDFQAVACESVASRDRTFQIIHDAGHALDHPIRAGHPEGRYLKFLVGRVQPLS